MRQLIRRGTKSATADPGQSEIASSSSSSIPHNLSHRWGESVCLSNSNLTHCVECVGCHQPSASCRRLESTHCDGSHSETPPNPFPRYPPALPGPRRRSPCVNIVLRRLELTFIFRLWHGIANHLFWDWFVLCSGRSCMSVQLTEQSPQATHQASTTSAGTSMCCKKLLRRLIPRCTCSPSPFGPRDSAQDR